MNSFVGDENNEKIYGCGGAFQLTGSTLNQQWGGTPCETGPEANVAAILGLEFSQQDSYDGWEGCCYICGANLQMAGKLSDGWSCQKNSEIFATGIWLKGKNK